MAVKTITNDLEACDLLAARKRKNESFSQLIKRIAPDDRYSAHNLPAHLEEVALSPDALDQVEAEPPLRRDTERFARVPGVVVESY